MSTVTSIRRPAAGCLETLLAGQPQLPASPWSQVNALRAEAVEHLDRLAMPTLRDEEWRFTDLSPLTCLSFQPVRSATRLDSADIAHFFLDDAPTLAAAVSRCRWVAGCESYALIVALAAGRSVVCTLPPWAPPARLPPGKLIHLRTIPDPR